MPRYEYNCSKHGRFEVVKPMSRSGQIEACPKCIRIAERIFIACAIKVLETKRLPLGNGSPGKIVLSKDTGGLDIFIPSMGAMEQDEVDYIAEGAIEKERARVKRNQGHARSEKQARIQAYAELGRRAKRGQRAKTIREAIAQEGDKLIKV